MINFIRIITKNIADKLRDELHVKGYEASWINLKGKENVVSISYTFTKRENLKMVVEIIEKPYSNYFKQTRYKISQS